MADKVVAETVYRFVSERKDEGIIVELSNPAIKL